MKHYVHLSDSQALAYHRLELVEEREDLLFRTFCRKRRRGWLSRILCYFGFHIWVNIDPNQTKVFDLNSYCCRCQEGRYA